LHDNATATGYADAIAEFAALSGHQIEQEARDNAHALGLSETTLALPLSQLSGGERARVALAQALLAHPPLLLLDEPDNHLDIQGIEWLEQMLLRYDGTVVLITHDRELLDRVAQQIIEVEDGQVTQVRERFADFLVHKRERIELQTRLYLEQQRRVTKLKESIRGIETHARGIENRTIDFHYRKQAAKIARRAVMMKRRLQRQLESEAHIEKPKGEREKMSVAFDSTSRRAGEVLQLSGICKSFGERLLLQDIDLRLSRGQRLALIGPNGCGKSTLMQIALGLQPTDRGEVWLAPNVSRFYCDQQQAGLDPELSPADLLERHTQLNYNQIRYLLDRLLFKDESVHNPIRHLSGGERTRLLLALLMNARADLLLLDEPTNHLDWSGIEALQIALANYDGALWLISHDRRLIQNVATEVVELSEG
jgi:ATP-binding cassette, subfamily F, member 3